MYHCDAIDYMPTQEDISHLLQSGRLEGKGYLPFFFFIWFNFDRLCRRVDDDVSDEIVSVLI